MLVSDMLKMFKITAQAKGLDTFRFISDEDICVYINQAIVDKVRAVVGQSSLMQYPGKSYINDNSISGTNILKNLHYIVDCEIDTSQDANHNQLITGATEFFNAIVMFITAIDIKYIKDNDETTVPCRLVDPDKFYNLGRDYCNTASWDNPIVTYFKDNDSEYRLLGMYGSKEFPTAKIPNSLNIHYIKHPDKLTVDFEGQYYDLPDYAFPEIVNIAVNSYFKSVGATSQQLENIKQVNNDD